MDVEPKLHPDPTASSHTEPEHMDEEPTEDKPIKDEPIKDEPIEGQPLKRKRDTPSFPRLSDLELTVDDEAQLEPKWYGYCTRCNKRPVVEKPNPRTPVVVFVERQSAYTRRQALKFDFCRPCVMLVATYEVFRGYFAFGILEKAVPMAMRGQKKKLPHTRPLACLMSLVLTFLKETDNLGWPHAMLPAHKRFNDLRDDFESMLKMSLRMTHDEQFWNHLGRLVIYQMKTLRQFGVKGGIRPERCLYCLACRSSHYAAQVEQNSKFEEEVCNDLVNGRWSGGWRPIEFGPWSQAIAPPKPVTRITLEPWSANPPANPPP